MNVVRHRFTFLLLLMLVLLISSPGVRAQSGDSDKIAPLLSKEMATQLLDHYYDVIVVFRGKADAARLSTFNRKVKTYRVLPMGRILLNKSEIGQVASWDEVLFIDPSRELKLFNAEGRALTRAEEVQKQLGLTGSGVSVAVIDTGADGLHNDLVNVRKNYAVAGETGIKQSGIFVSATPDGIDVETSVVEYHNGDAGARWNNDEYGHGTHVIGTIAGTGADSDGYLRGMAPAASIVSYSTSSGIVLPFVIEAYDHVIAKGKELDIRVVSNSWGTDPAAFNPHASANVASRMAFEAGILSVFAAGNDGAGADTLNPYAAAPYVLGVGATSKSYALTGFSSRGRPDGNHDRELALANLKEFLASSSTRQSTWDHANKPIGLYRPGVVAPGEDIVSAQNPVHPMTTSGTSYGAASGTSMATPHVSGLIALAHQARDQKGGSRLSPLDMIRLFEVTANKKVMYGYEAYDAGAGFADVRAAVDAINAGNIPAAVTASDLVRFNPGPVVVKSGPYSGTAAINSFQTNEGYGLHPVTVEPDAIKLFADAGWAQETEKLYISLYAPGVDPKTGTPAAQSAGLLATTNYRFVEVKFPAPGVWHVRVDGRVNLLATEYSGKWEVMVPDNIPPTAELTLSTDKVSGSEPLGISAQVYDGNGISSITEARVRVVTANGKLLHSFDKSAFALQGDRLVFSQGVGLSGKAPWTVEVFARDASGLFVVEQAIVGRK
jgi:serine protease AprX